jgi:Phage P22-like portal protein
MTDKIVKQALERFELAEEAETEFRRQSAEDLEFVAGNQWNQQAKNNREAAGLPCYTVNKTAEYLRHITNEMRQNKPTIQVDPVNSDASKGVADIVSGLIKHIEYDSAADTAYDTSSWYAAATGLGYIRIVSEYEDYTSDNQKLMIKTIENPATVFMDPTSKLPDGSDAEWCFIVKDIPHDEYTRKYGESALATSMATSDWTEMKNTPQWLTENTVRVAEYYFKEYTTKTLYTIQRAPDYELPDGVTYTSYERPSDEDLESGKALITKKRTVNIPVIKWCTLNCKEVLEETVWPGEWLPVVPVKGNEFWVNGKKQLYGSVRGAKDSQRAYNWHTSVQTQMVAAAPLAPFVGFKGQFKGVEHNWRDVNVAPIAYLEVDSKDSNGFQQQIPQRLNSEPAIQAVSATRMQAADDIKSIFGTFDASMGATSNETSGTAILARTNQSNISNYHFYDNLTRSITHIGRILVQVIPTFYDTERVIRIVNEDGTRGQKTINTTDNQGNPKNDFSIGKYDVVIETGPSYATRRQEAAVEMQNLIKAYPTSGPLIADLAAGAMDWPGSSLVAKRLKAAVPPEVLAATGENNGDDMEPAAKAQMLQQQLQQANQNLQLLNAHAHTVEQELKLAHEENKILAMEAKFDVARAENDKIIKMKTLQQNEESTVLEFRVKVRELELQEEQLKLEREKMSITAIRTASDIDRNHFDKVHQVHTSLTEQMNDDMGGPDKIGGSFDQ